MQYAIELYYDKKTEEKLFNLAQRVADEKLSTKFLEWKTRPHVTLACFSDADETKCITLLEKFASERKVLPAHLGSVGMFTDTKTIFISPIMNKSMYALQSELHDCMKEFETKGWEWYLPDRWVPHCGIAMMNEDSEDAFYKASTLILQEFEKISGEFVAIGLVKITFPVDEIYTIDLCR